LKYLKLRFSGAVYSYQRLLINVVQDRDQYRLSERKLEGSVTMKQFKELLAESVNVLSQLSNEFENLECYHSDVLTEQYPFSQDLREVVSRLIDWRDSINERR
jgi:phosphoglycerate-specific signal transduction histidine kinase